MISQWVVCQITIQKAEELALLQQLPQEHILVHSNTSLLLTGEYLYYKVYAVNAKESGLSQLSKVAFIELVANDGALVFRHKVRLVNGMGQGDFFVPTVVASGVYKLIGYTNWMQNGSQNRFFQSDVTVINPYRSNQKELMIAPTDDTTTSNDSVRHTDVHKENPTAQNAAQDLRLQISGAVFGRRKKVVLTLGSSLRGTFIGGDYSLAVRKKSRNDTSTLKDILRATENIANATVDRATTGDTIFLPELRGELYQGKVIATAANASVKNLKVAFSIPGDAYILEVVETDDFGNFYITVAKNYQATTGFLQVLSSTSDKYKIQMLEPRILDHTKLYFKQLKTYPEMRTEILRRSIHNQIENSYFQFRPDSVATTSAALFLNGKQHTLYKLDDFTRFATVAETVVEILQDVNTKKVTKNQQELRVKGYDYASLDDIRPLILLDGFLVENHRKLLSADARKIKAISIYRHRIVNGPEIYEGAVVITTTDGFGYTAMGFEDEIARFNLLKPQPLKTYYTQVYEGTSTSRLPDDRLQLLWKPTIKTTDKEQEIVFFTSDVLGEFEIELVGISDKGKVVCLQETFVVE